MNEGARDANDAQRYYNEARWREKVLELLREILTELQRLRERRGDTPEGS